MMMVLILDEGRAQLPPLVSFIFSTRFVHKHMLPSSKAAGLTLAGWFRRARALRADRERAPNYADLPSLPFQTQALKM